MRALRTPSTDSAEDTYIRLLLSRVALLPFVTPRIYGELAGIPLHAAEELLWTSSQGWGDPFTARAVRPDPSRPGVSREVYTLSTFGLKSVFGDADVGAVGLQRAHVLTRRGASGLAMREWRAANLLGLLVALLLATGDFGVQFVTWRFDPARRGIALPEFMGLADAYLVLRQQDGSALDVAIFAVAHEKQVQRVRRAITKTLQGAGERVPHVLVWTRDEIVERVLRESLQRWGGDLPHLWTTNGTLLQLDAAPGRLSRPGMAALRLGQDVWCQLPENIATRVVWPPLIPNRRDA